jgi:S-DNA-T family DNA segregation ATPase FtsK/SpoIIIE
MDSSVSSPVPTQLSEMVLRSERIRVDESAFAYLESQGPVLSRWPFIPDEPPDPATVERLLSEYAQAYAGASRSLPAERILVPANWSGDSSRGVEATIGLDDGGQLGTLELGDDPAHGLIGGMTGMGKSNLLHVLIAQLTSRYSPDELVLDLLDFREGVGFAPYRTLPHAHAVALETEREFALSVLRDLQSEITRRGKLFGAAGVDQFAAYRARGKKLPRRLLLINEFQVLFAEDDQLARDAAAVLEDLAKRGRGFGIHLLLSSQSPSVAGPYLSRIYNQMGLRVALRCRTADALAILGEGNDAAAKLEEPGEAIVNAELGQVEGNRRVRVALLTREQLTERLAAVAALGAGHYPPPVTFEGQAPADLAANPQLLALKAGNWAPAAGTAEAFLGEAIELKGPTNARFERYPRSNLLIAGPDEADAYGLLVAAVVSLALQQPEARFSVVELARPTSPVAEVFRSLAEQLPERIELVGSREAPALLANLAQQLDTRLDGRVQIEAATYLVITGLQRWRELRGPDAYTSTDESKLLLRLLDEGPELGIHTILWSDGYASLERTLKRGAQTNFDLRAIFRVPENDAQNLLESTAAARLADNRALFRHEEWPLGKVEKFKPYRLPEPDAPARLLGAMRRMA